MGGPNIRTDHEGIKSFLELNSFVDMYVTNEGEVPFTTLLTQISSESTPDEVRSLGITACFSLVNNNLKGEHSLANIRDLDYIPSPYQTGILDSFLIPEFIPLFESNRGCPYTCTFCNWGSSAMRKLKTFGMDRIHGDMTYVAQRGITFDNWTFADANFGILSRDIDIARDIKALYDKYHPFHSLTIWWAKNAKKNMVEIAKILKGLSNAYVAFQTLDTDVGELIRRKNIPIARLEDLQKSLVSASERFHTDVLLGLPGETRESHLNSLQRAYELGFDSIGGGEIRLLKGSELETDESREKFGLKTKYRLVQEGFGVYRGQFIGEFEESVRSTNWITEEEMINLRVLRAIFYGAITIGEFDPLMKYLKASGVNVIEVFEKLIEKGSESIDWLVDKTQNEWFNTEEAANEYFSDEANRKQLLDNPVIKLNHDFLSYLLLSRERYEAFYWLVQNTILGKTLLNFPHLLGRVVIELGELCRQRNYVVNCLRGSIDTYTTVSLSGETMKQLVEIGYLKEPIAPTSSSISLQIDESIAKSIRDSLQTPRIQGISLLTQKFSIYLKPVSP
jgi:radical SAM superfamily enzyme YgiQ (UPF0313 family)